MKDLDLNPYADVDWDAVQRHKVQLHAHTSYPTVEGHSGSDPPERVIDDYRAAGYSALALTDHEYNIEEPTYPWSRWDRDTDELGMVAIQGVELGGGDGRVERDLLSLFNGLANSEELSVHGVLEEIGDRGGLAIVPHPSRYDRDGSWYVEYVREHAHLLGVEVVNAADRYPTDRDVWDNLQERVDERLVWGFANDDYHGRDQGYSFDRSRNVVFVDELSEAAIEEALADGRFVYQHAVEGESRGPTEGEAPDATGGQPPTANARAPPTVEAIRHDADRGELAIEADGWDEIQWASAGEVVARGPELRYRDLDGAGDYVRARLVAESGSETGTQPFGLD